MATKAKGKLKRVKFDPSSVSPIPAPKIVQSPKHRAIRDFLRITGLGEDFIPKSSVDPLIQRIERYFPEDESVISVLEGSSEPEAMAIVGLIHSLDDNHKRYVTWDHLLAAVKVDPARMLGLIQEEVYRQWGTVTSIIAALKSPSIMKARASYAHLPDGHMDAKMVLQSSGSVPVPKNQVTNVSIRAGQIGDRVLNMGNTKSLEEVVAECDTDLDNVEADEADIKSLPGAAPVGTQPDIDSVDDLDDLDED